MKKIFYILSICVMTILQPSYDALDLAQMCIRDISETLNTKEYESKSCI